jgi:hypothetical protein
LIEFRANNEQKIFFYSERYEALESAVRLGKTGRRQGGIQESHEELEELATAKSKRAATKSSDEK